MTEEFGKNNLYFNFNNQRLTFDPHKKIKDIFISPNPKIIVHDIGNLIGV